MPPKLIMHSATWNILKKNIPVRKSDLVIDELSLNGMEVQLNDFMEREKWSGKYILPNGSVVESRDVRLSEKFCEYGPEDIWYLLWAGIIRKHMEPLMYMFNKHVESLMFGPYNSYDVTFNGFTAAGSMNLIKRFGGL